MMRFIPPDVETSWSSNSALNGWSVDFSGAAFAGTSNAWRWEDSRTVTVPFTDMDFTNSTEAIYEIAPVNESNEFSCYYALTNLVINDWPATSLIYSNDVLISGLPDLIGARLEITLDGTSYELTGLPNRDGGYGAPWDWDLRPEDYSQRVAVVRQLQWMTTASHGNPRRLTALRGWVPSGSYPTYDSFFLGDMSPPPVIPPYDPDIITNLNYYGSWYMGSVDIWHTTKRWYWDDDIDDYVYYFTNDWGAFRPETIIDWPDLVSYALSNLSPRLNADVTLAGRVTRNDYPVEIDLEGGWESPTGRFVQVVAPPSFPAHLVHGASYYDKDSNKITWSNVLTIATDPAGPDELYARSRITIPWEGGRNPLTLDDFQWIDFDPSRFAWLASYCNYPGRDPYWAGESETLYWLPATRRFLRDETWVIRWQFDSLPYPP
ncbi:MAG: hypothetical protein M5U15_13775 [Kiritimatiellae bacterium]|nr:hypothetical protein [Kiritimatiellia bacterium]